MQRAEQVNGADKWGQIKIQESIFSEAPSVKRNFALTPFACGANYTIPFICGANYPPFTRDKQKMHATLVTAYIALGANLGDASTTVQEAIKNLSFIPHTSLAKHSSLYHTDPIDSTGPDYINAVAEVHTLLSAPELLQQLQIQEHAAGRQRPYPNAPRTLDLDILLYGSAQIQSPKLTVPHPRMAQRAFVLFPLREIARQLVSDAALQAMQQQAIRKL